MHLGSDWGFISPGFHLIVLQHSWKRKAASGASSSDFHFPLEDEDGLQVLMYRKGKEKGEGQVKSRPSWAMCRVSKEDSYSI